MTSAVNTHTLTVSSKLQSSWLSVGYWTSSSWFATCKRCWVFNQSLLLLSRRGRSYSFTMVNDVVVFTISDVLKDLQLWNYVKLCPDLISMPVSCSFPSHLWPYRNDSESTEARFAIKYILWLYYCIIIYNKNPLEMHLLKWHRKHPKYISIHFQIFLSFPCFSPLKFESF